ncbi:MAG: HalOD1 output domain-containing protein [Haloarculaceae archaeon]
MQENDVDSAERVESSTDSSSSVYHTKHEMGNDKSLSVSVVEALADCLGVPAVEIDQPLYEAVDPDALDRLFTDGGTGSAHVVFTASDHEITVTSSGDIFIRQVD